MDGCLDPLSSLQSARSRDDHGHVSHFRERPDAVADEPVLAEVLAVITGDGDDAAPPTRLVPGVDQGHEGLVESDELPIVQIGHETKIGLAELQSPLGEGFLSGECFRSRP